MTNVHKVKNCFQIFHGGDNFLRDKDVNSFIKNEKLEAFIKTKESITSQELLLNLNDLKLLLST